MKDNFPSRPIAASIGSSSSEVTHQPDLDQFQAAGQADCFQSCIRKRKASSMPLIFPNRSRSYDNARNAVRFLGYDGMFEVPFFIEATALGKSGSAEIIASECLVAFDAARGTILEVAKKAYARGRRTLYVLKAKDFR
jgi:hypothetical protein